MRILVAEDDADAAGMYRAVLESRGHQVTFAFDGRNCFNIYRKAMKELELAGVQASASVPFDVVVLDYMLPLGDGLSVAKEIMGLNPMQRIIFCSAIMKENLVRSAREFATAIETIQKPFEPEMLANLVENAQAQKGQARKKKEESIIDDNSDVDMLLEQLKSIQQVSKA